MIHSDTPHREDSRFLRGEALSAAQIRAFDSSGEAVSPVIAEHCALPGATVVELHVDLRDDLSRFHQLDPAEKALVEKAVDRRKGDFGDARWCAHQALRTLATDRPILRDERGMPRFPQEVAGSLTHTRGYRAAVVASTQQWRSLGIDAEPAESLPDDVVGSIATPQELDTANSTGKKLGIDCMDTVLFSAKESIYKSWYPLAKRFLDFDGAVVEIHPDGRFSARLVVDPTPVECIEGSWMVGGGFVITLAGVPY